MASTLTPHLPGERAQGDEWDVIKGMLASWKGPGSDLGGAREGRCAGGGDRAMWVRGNSELVEGDKRCGEAVGAMVRFVRGKYGGGSDPEVYQGEKAETGAILRFVRGKRWRRERS